MTHFFDIFLLLLRNRYFYGWIIETEGTLKMVGVRVSAYDKPNSAGIDSVSAHPAEKVLDS